MSPDGHAIIDQLAPYEGLFGILGDSGTNFKTGPAIGKCMAEWITEGAPQSVDLRPFRASRLAEGSSLPVSMSMVTVRWTCFAETQVR